jgi:threonine dehydratase
LKELSYRREGKKTMGYEIAEQFGWNVPDVILYPTGGGTGLIGIWKAFDELEQLGWIGKKVREWLPFNVNLATESILRFRIINRRQHSKTADSRLPTDYLFPNLTRIRSF